MTTVAFVCVRNAGRSQMAHAFAERAVAERDMDADLLTGGTDPAEAVHDNVVAAMREVGVDLSGRTPREVTPDELADADVVVTMGCSAEGVCPATWRGDVSGSQRGPEGSGIERFPVARDWDLTDPHGTDAETTREIRDEIERRVDALLDELADDGTAAGDGPSGNSPPS